MYASPNRYLTPEEYLALEARSQVKHEYIDGQVYAMAGGSKAHNLISLNIAVGLRAQLKAPCQTFMADIKVMARENARYYYPDVVVSCDDGNDLNGDRLHPNPGSPFAKGLQKSKGELLWVKGGLG